jgi:hypothetical protein
MLLPPRAPTSRTASCDFSNQQSANFHLPLTTRKINRFCLEILGSLSLRQKR